MQENKCSICHRPEGMGYTLPLDHYANVLDVIEDTPVYISYSVHPDNRPPFHLWKNNDGATGYIDSGEVLEVLEATGIDACYEIDVDEPLAEVKIINGKCAACIAREQQISLF